MEVHLSRTHRKARVLVRNEQAALVAFGGLWPIETHRITADYGEHLVCGAVGRQMDGAMAHWASGSARTSLLKSRVRQRSSRRLRGVRAARRATGPIYIEQC